VRMPEPIARFDTWVDDQLERMRGNPVSDAVFTTSSQLGEFSLIWQAANVARGVTGIGTPKQVPVFAVLVGAESLLVNQGVKRLFGRVRPTEAGDERYEIGARSRHRSRRGTPAPPPSPPPC